MTPPSGPAYALEVARRDMALALKTVARMIGRRRRPTGVKLCFAEGRLAIEIDGAVTDMPASGTWPLPIFVRGTWARKLARRMPVGNPIHLRVDAGRLHTNRYSESCAWTRIEPPQPADALPDAVAGAPAMDENLSISEAARILEPLLVTRLDLEALVAEARARGTAMWSEEEKKMTAIIARAWALLAPLGVETGDIRRLVDKAVRNAWK